MIQRHPTATRTDTLFPYTSLFRSKQSSEERVAGQRRGLADPDRYELLVELVVLVDVEVAGVGVFGRDGRSEERRVGKECVSTCRCWWSPYNATKQPTTTHVRTVQPMRK